MTFIVFIFAGLANQNLTFDDGIIMINYTHGETCHKIYERSTAILFSCDHSKNPVRSYSPSPVNLNIEQFTVLVWILSCIFWHQGKPEFIRETADCTYLFDWHTALACPSFKTTTCSYKWELLASLLTSKTYLSESGVTLEISVFCQWWKRPLLRFIHLGSAQI